MKRNNFTIFYSLFFIVIYIVLYFNKNFKLQDYGLTLDYIYFNLYYVLFVCFPYILFNYSYKENIDKKILEVIFYRTSIILSILMSFILMLLIVFIVLPFGQLFYLYDLILAKDFHWLNFFISSISIIFFIITIILMFKQLLTLIKIINKSILTLKKDGSIDKRMDKFFKIGLKFITFLTTIITFCYLLIGQQEKVDISVIGLFWGMMISFLTIELFFYNRKSIYTFWKMIEPKHKFFKC